MELYLRCLQFILALLLVIAVDGGATGRCPASQETSFNLSVASRRNLTGHWIISMNGVTEHPQESLSANSPVGVVIDIGQRTASCEDTHTTQLTATAVLNPVSTVHRVTEIFPPTTSVDPVIAATSDVTPSVTETTSQAPTAGYEMVNGLGYYKVQTDATTWEQARDKCVQEGAHLIVINSNLEVEIAKKRPTSWKWVGFDDIAIEGKYTTVLGKPLSNSGYTQWWTQAKHNNTNSNCGTVYVDGDLGVEPCNSKLGFICERSVQ